MAWPLLWAVIAENSAMPGAVARASNSPLSETVRLFPRQTDRLPRVRAGTSVDCLTDSPTDAAFDLRGITHVEIHGDKGNAVSLAIPRKLCYRLIAEESEELAGAQ